jgi:hypothetical protein
MDDDELARRRATERAHALLSKAMREALAGLTLHEPVGLFVAPDVKGRNHGHITTGWHEVRDLGDEVRRHHEELLSARHDAALQSWVDG